MWYEEQWGYTRKHNVSSMLAYSQAKNLRFSKEHSCINKIGIEYLEFIRIAWNHREKN